MKRRRHAAVSLVLLALASGCASHGAECPRPGVETARRCKRACVVSAGRAETPLTCACMAECLCWQMSGHVRRPDGDAAGGAALR